MSEGKSQRESKWSQLARLPWWVLVPLLAYLALVVLYWSSGSAVEAWDDSYFFKRIGKHILENGSASWNPEEGPVYGNTSQLFQLLTLIPLVIAEDYYIALVKVLLGCTSLFLFGLLCLSCRRLYPKEPLALAVVFLMASTPLILLLMHSGMETIPAIGLLTLNLLCIVRNDESRRGTALVVVTTVLVYLVRPDALLITIVVVASYYPLQERRVPWRLALYCGLALGATLLVMYLYFGTAFPLSFHLKSRALTTYSDHFASLDMRGKRKNVVSLLLMAAPLLYIAGHGKGWWRTSLVLSFFVFVSYHYLSTVEIMSYRARFYLPGLVPLVFAAMASASRFRETSRLPISLAFCAAHIFLIDYCFDQRMIWVMKEGLISRVPFALYLTYGIASAALLLVGKCKSKLTPSVVALVSLIGAHRGLDFPKELRLLSDRVLIDKQIIRYTTVRGIKTVEACVAQPLHLYHTEIGVPGLVFSESVVTDMAGLMDRQIAFDGLSFEQRCTQDQPHLVFLPHRNYAVLREEIAASRCIKNYTLVVKNSSSPLYLRNDLVADFLDCAQRSGKTKWIDPSLLRR